MTGMWRAAIWPMIAATQNTPAANHGHQSGHGNHVRTTATPGTSANATALAITPANPRTAESVSD